MCPSTFLAFWAELSLAETQQYASFFSLDQDHTISTSTNEHGSVQYWHLSMCRHRVQIIRNSVGEFSFKASPPAAWHMMT